jgi:hypothetical protein
VEIDDYARETVASLRRGALVQSDTLKLDCLELACWENLPGH